MKTKMSNFTPLMILAYFIILLFAGGTIAFIALAPNEVIEDAPVFSLLIIVLFSALSLAGIIVGLISVFNTRTLRVEGRCVSFKHKNIFSKTKEYDITDVRSIIFYRHASDEGSLQKLDSKIDIVFNERVDKFRIYKRHPYVSFAVAGTKKNLAKIKSIWPNIHITYVDLSRKERKIFPDK